MPIYLRHHDRRHLVTALALLWSSAGGHAASTPINCPAEISAHTIHLNSTPAGWIFYADAPLYLHSAEPMTGPPEKRERLKPDAEHGNHTRWSSTYRLDGPAVDGKWILCGYGAHDALTLSRQLDNATSICRIHYRKGAKVEQHAIQVDCL